MQKSWTLSGTAFDDINRARSRTVSQQVSESAVLQAGGGCAPGVCDYRSVHRPPPPYFGVKGIVFNIPSLIVFSIQLIINNLFRGVVRSKGLETVFAVAAALCRILWSLPAARCRSEPCFEKRLLREGLSGCAVTTIVRSKGEILCMGEARDLR